MGARFRGSRFRDRPHAGRVLASLCTPLASEAPLVLGLPRGGVVVAAEVARALCASLDVVCVRKLGVPGHEELAMGAIATGGVRVLNDSVIGSLGLLPDEIEPVAAREAAELARRERRYRGGRGPLALSGRVALIVDDGLATGATMRAAVAAVRAGGAARIYVAVPVGAEETCRRLEQEAARVICALRAPELWSVGAWYDDFGQVGDDEVARILQRTEAAGIPAG